MNVLVIKPGWQDLTYSCFGNNHKIPVFDERIEGYRGTGADETSVREALDQIISRCSAVGSMPDVIALRVPFGGTSYSESVLANEASVEHLRKLVVHAPLHLPPVLTALGCLQKPTANVPVALVFDTAFFTKLPPREYLYAVDEDLADKLGLRRYGFHGHFHKAACAKVVRRWRRTKNDAAPRILSICLEPQPEVSAAIGLRPVTTTGGITPLEGIPGETTCGHIDSSVALNLSKEKKWGPEQINLVLTEQSGLTGLAGRRVTLKEVLTTAKPDLGLAYKVVEYRILQACGAGMAAMGGVDAIVFSGQYASVSCILGQWLASRLAFDETPDKGKILLECLEDSLESLISEEACSAMSKQQPCGLKL